MNENQPKATHKGVLHIANVDIQCFVLEDKRRVITGRSLTKAIGMRGRGPGASRIYTHQSLKPFIGPDLVYAIENPLQFKVGGLPTTGFEATILREICEAILNARDANMLNTEQELRYATAADTLIRAFATVGIIALVDEATGYQAERDRDELQTILAAYMAPELMPWTQRFPPEFYEQMFRLWNWQYSPLSLAKIQRTRQGDESINIINSYRKMWVIHTLISNL